MEGTSKRYDCDHSFTVTLISFGKGHVPVEGFDCNPRTSTHELQPRLCGRIRDGGRED